MRAPGRVCVCVFVHATEKEEPRVGSRNPEKGKRWGEKGKREERVIRRKDSLGERAAE